MKFTIVDITSLISAIAALVAAFHAAKAKKATTSVSANVNGNLSNLISILGKAAIQIPHSVATDVIAAPPVAHPETTDVNELTEQMAEDWLAKIKGP